MMTSTTTSTQNTAATTAKPVKLRSACNNCFTAKVKCDGNKQGCRRCLDRRLGCHYSESRVGKVVGKRRKRPLPDSSSTTTTTPKDDQSAMMTLSSSPACTNPVPQRQDSLLSWDSFMSFEDCGPMQLDGLPRSPDEGLFQGSVETSQSPMYGTPMFMNNGLPTPGMSPSESSFLDSTFNSSISSRATSVCTDASARFSSDTPASVMLQTSTSAEDEETICIKLLSHLKRNSADTHQSHEAQLTLVQKTNAVIRKLMRSCKVRSDYTCLLLLSTIATHLVAMCESLIGEAKLLQDEYVQDQYASKYMEAVADYFDAALIMPLQTTLTTSAHQNFNSLQHEIALSTKTVVHDTALLVSVVGDCLKQRPSPGFEQMGRHESLHIELDRRLQSSLTVIE